MIGAPGYLNADFIAAVATRSPSVLAIIQKKIHPPDGLLYETPKASVLRLASCWSDRPMISGPIDAAQWNITQKDAQRAFGTLRAIAKMHGIEDVRLAVNPNLEWDGKVLWVPQKAYPSLALWHQLKPEHFKQGGHALAVLVMGREAGVWKARSGDRDSAFFMMGVMGGMGFWTALPAIDESGLDGPLASFRPFLPDIVEFAAREKTSVLLALATAPQARRA